LNQNPEPYKEMKDSGVEWIGKVPAHWDRASIGSIATPKSITGGLSRELLSVYLKLGVVKFSDVDEKRTNATSEDLSKYQAVEPGDFVLNNQQAWRGSVGVSKYSGIISPAYIVCSLSNNLNREYANLLFRDSSMVNQYVVCSKGVGSIQRNLYWPYLKRTWLFTPPLNEQAAIVKYLDYMDQRIKKLIAAKKKLIILLEEQKQAIINQAVTKGLDPDVATKSSGIKWLGEIPKHWEVRRLNQVLAKITNGYVGPTRDIMRTGGVPYIQGIHIKKQSIAFTPDGPFYVDEKWSNDHSRSILSEDDVLLVQTGSIGQVGIVSSQYERANCHALIILRFKKGVGTGKYLLWTLSSSFGLESLMRIKTGDILFHLNATKVKYLAIPLPGIEEQKRISSWVEDRCITIEKSKLKIKKEISLLEEYQKRLNSDVVTGNLDVREAAANLPNDNESWVDIQ
jgi:type I restriction enzyme, S subunit